MYKQHHKTSRFTVPGQPVAAEKQVAGYIEQVKTAFKQPG